MSSSSISKTSRLVKNSALFAIGELSSKVIVFLMVPLYTYALSTQEYSISDLITTTVALASPFFSLVIYEAVMRFTLDRESDKRVVFSVGFWIFIFGSVLLVLMSYVVFQYVTLLKSYWLLFVVYYLSFNLYNIVSGFVKGLEHIRLFSIVGIIYTVAMVVLNILFLLYFHLGIEGYLLASILSTVIACIILIIKDKLTSYIISPFDIPKGNWNSMLQYACPMIPNSAMWWINNSSDRYFVTYLVSAAANGIYTVAYKIPSIFSVLISIFMQAWQISIVDEFGTDKGTKFFNQTYDVFFRFCVIISSLLIFMSKFLATFLFLKDFYSAWMFSVVLIVGFFFHALSGFLGTVYTTAKKTKMLFVSTVVAAVINIILTYIFILLWGVMGAAIATTISYFVVYIIRRIDAKRYIEISSNITLFVMEIALLILQALFVICDYEILSLIMSSIIFMVLLVLNKKMIIKMVQNISEKFKNNE